VRILVTNDDGIDSPALHSLVVALARWAAASPAGEEREIIVVVPDSNYSGAAAAVGEVYARDGIGYSRRVVPGAPDIEAYALDAAPALCAIVGCLGGFGPKPDLIVSGINLGVNVGRSVLHSGTVGAILTGAQLGISGLAVSIQATKDAPYDTAANVAVAVLDELLAAPARTLFNLNVPSVALTDLKGIRRGRISTAGIIKRAVGDGQGDRTLRVGESGMLALNLGSAVPELGDVSDEEPDDDGALVAAGYAALTALRGVHEDSDPGSDDLVRAAIGAIEQHLGARA
jgi:5'-nucleotidase